LLSEAIKQAKAIGLSNQAILEARFLYYVDKKDLPAIAKLSSELIEQSKKFKPAESEIFALKEDWLAVVEYSKAIDSLLKKNKPDFKKHITEAFWLSPRQASAFAPHIEEMRKEEVMSSITISEGIILKNILTQETQNLKSIRDKNTTTLIHFWSPWSREAEQTFPDFLATSQECIKNNISVASILIEQSPQVEKDAIAFIKTNTIDTKTNWLSDSKENSLARLLRIQDIPTFVLINKDGKILFNGHPSNPKMWEQIKKIAPKFTRPQPNQLKQ